MSSPITTIARFGHRPHRLNRKKYGQPYVLLGYAGHRFQQPGIYLVVINSTWRLPGTSRAALRLERRAQT